MQMQDNFPYANQKKKGGRPLTIKHYTAFLHNVDICLCTVTVTDYYNAY